MSKNGKSRKIIIFTCNWHAYSSLEDAGISGQSYSSGLIPIRISCLGRITPGLILKAFEGGADAVCLAGCPEGACRYQNGNIEAWKIYKESKELIKLLGYNEELLTYTLLPAGDGETFVKEMDALVQIIEKKVKKQ